MTSSFDKVTAAHVPVGPSLHVPAMQCHGHCEFLWTPQNVEPAVAQDVALLQYYYII